MQAGCSAAIEDKQLRSFDKKHRQSAVGAQAFCPRLCHSVNICGWYSRVSGYVKIASTDAGQEL